MGNPTHLERYKNLIDYIEKMYREGIKIEDIEDVSFYSYRNINRIFFALHRESIGQYVKRRKLEKAAEYLKFSNEKVSEVALEIGYSDIAAFSKAFKKQFNCSPTSFRDSCELKRYITQKTIFPLDKNQGCPLNFEIEEIHDFEVLYLTYQGSYENIKGLNKTWMELIQYASEHNLIHDDTIILGEILDDNEITETTHCRYNAAIVLERPLDFSPKGLFKSKRIEKQKYAKFIHKGSHETCVETYNKIYAHWVSNVELEFEDKPTLEFYLNDRDEVPEEDLLTEIYIPIV